MLNKSGRSASANLWLPAGMLAGLGVALWSLVQEPKPSLQGDAIARVGTVLISRADYQQALDAATRDRESALGAQDRQRILDSLIDEELLLQHAIEIGLASQLRQVRGSLVRALLDSHIAAAGLTPPDAKTLAAFFATQAAFFKRPDELRVKVLRYTDAALANALVRDLRADGPAALLASTARHGQRMPVPDAWLPATRLRQYLGDQLSEHTLALAAGEVADPLPVDEAWYVIYVLQRRAGQLPELGSIRAEVESEYLRRQAERSLQATVAELRKEKRVVVADD